MELRRYWAMARRWLWLIVLTTALAGGAAFAYSTMAQPVYRASTTLLVNLANTAGTVAYNDLMASERIARTYGQLVKTRPVLDEVVKALNLPVTATELERLVTVQVVRDTQLLELNVEYTDPDTARDIANKISEVFIAQNAELQRGQVASSRDKLSEQLAAVESDLESVGLAIATLRGNPNAALTDDEQTELARLEAEQARYQSQYTALLKSYDEMRLAESRSINIVAVAEPAITPIEPIRPRPSTDTLLGAIVGLMLGVGIAFLLEYLDDTVKQPEDVDRVAGVATLAQVHKFKRSGGDERDVGLIAKRNPKSPFVESYRVLRTNIQYSTIDHPPRLLLVTSSLAGEGKTTTAGNLAAIMAQAGKSVIVVDADLRRPALHRLFALDNSVGLTSVLVNENLKLEAAIQPTNVQGVRAVTSGPLPPYPAELLGSARMGIVLRALAEMADFIIVDTPPVLVATDATAISAQVDGVIIVVEAGKTRTDALARAVDGLMIVRQNVVGVVINKVSQRAQGYYPGYYKSYYHGYYGDEERDHSNGRDDKGKGKGKDKDKVSAPTARA